jgi:coenzyme F420-0:L-glutamate ligase / coenzyme F420-1:gamma-L-glutamate ligase
MLTATPLQILPVPRMPAICAGDDLAALVIECLRGAGSALRDHDTVVFAQKIVSKSEGRIVDLATIVPSPSAQAVALVAQKDARLVEIILGESRRIVRCAKDVLIVEHKLGFVMANAGVDQSNVSADKSRELALLLPSDPDASAARLRAAIADATGCDVAVVINDSFGRPWRTGTVGVAIGCAGLPALLDLRGKRDLFGRRLQVTVVGYADEIAAAASLVMGQADEALPVVVLRGLKHAQAPQPASALVRPADEDLFR